MNGKPIGFLECAAERTKTSITLERKVRFLPIAVPVQCLTEPPWLPVWNELRTHQGLMASERPVVGFPVMPSPAAGGGWSQAQLNVTPAGEWLRNFLKNTATVGNIRVATHSCKATLLAWCELVFHMMPESSWDITARLRIRACWFTRGMLCRSRSGC